MKSYRGPTPVPGEGRNLPEQHRERFAQLKATTLKTARAWALKESLRELWHYMGAEGGRRPGCCA